MADEQFRSDLGGARSLRLLEKSDADELYGLVDANRDYLARWLPWVEASTPASIRDFLDAARRQHRSNDGFQCAILVDGAIVGVVGFHRVDWFNRATSIGYWLAETQQGRGTMTEAVRALVDHALGAWRLERVEIRCAVENARSRAIPERLAFEQEGVLRRAERVGVRWHDLVLYGRLR